MIKQILEWPAIVQGALGSGLFYLILVLGQKFINILIEPLSKLSKKNRKTTLRYQLLRFETQIDSSKIASKELDELNKT